MIFQASDVRIFNGSINTQSEHQQFTLNFMFKLFHVSVADADIKNSLIIINSFPQVGQI